MWVCPFSSSLLLVLLLKKIDQTFFVKSTEEKDSTEGKGGLGETST